MTTHYDVIIIGSGPGGEGAAFKLAACGQSVAMIESFEKIGGGCLHWGTIPSKTLRHSIQQIVDYRNNPLFANAVEALKVDYPKLLNAAEKTANEQVKIRRQKYDGYQLPVIKGFASFKDAHTIEVITDADVRELYTADKFIIASGSAPYHPKDVDFSHTRILDSDTVLKMKESPKSIIIYGAGVIGCEYASIFSHLGCKVTLVDGRDRLLGFLDNEISDALSYYLRQKGTVVMHNEKYTDIEAVDDGVVVSFESGKKAKADYLLWANGRTGNTEAMGLEKIGLKINHRGQIEVNKGFQTALEHIYAVGDVVGAPALASASFNQGRFVATCIAEDQCGWNLLQDIPIGIYTTPEISSLGKTEKELTEEKVPYEIGRAGFEKIARAQISGHAVGMLKILFHRDTLKILGIHCFGEQAAEIIHIGQAIMAQPGEQNTLHYFAETTFNYPTMAEAYRVAAIDGLQKLF